MNRAVRNVILYFALVVLVLWVLVALLSGGKSESQLSTSEFLRLVETEGVSEVVILQGENAVEAQIDNGDIVRANLPMDYQDDLVTALDENSIAYDVEAQSGSPWLGYLLNLLPVLLIIGALFFFMSQMQGGGSRVMSFGKAKAKTVTKDQPKVTFQDVAGVDEAIEELHEIKEFLESPQKFRQMGARIPKGVLLYGPPGTGKTLLARAVAGEAGVPFFSISGSDFVEMFVGVGAARVRDLFEQAKSNAPAIVFIDEIDAVGRHRGAGLGGGHDEREQTLNQLLVEMDGFDVKTGVILIAGTNRPDILDPALLRPGRFDRQIVVDRPDIRGRRAILDVHVKGKPLAEDVDLDAIAKRTPGFTGADIANLVNEGAILAARFGKKEITNAELEEAIDRVLIGPERKARVMSEKETKITAYHEAGHTLVAHVLPNLDPLHKVTIIPRGRSGGVTWTLPEEDRNYMTRAMATDQLAFAMGGRTSEEIVFGDFTSGASNDIEQATRIARQMVTRWGMSDSLGPVALGEKEHEVFLGRDFSAQPNYSDEVAAKIDNEVHRLIDRAHEEARQILSTHRDALDKLAAQLLEQETLERGEIAAVLSDIPKWTTLIEDTGQRIFPPASHNGQASDAAAAVTIE